MRYSNSTKAKEWNEIGFITGVDRSEYADVRKSHLYLAERNEKGEPFIMSPISPMCKRGWNRDEGSGFSIWRNNVSKRGICGICSKKALAFIKKYPIGTQFPQKFNEVSNA